MLSGGALLILQKMTDDIPCDQQQNHKRNICDQCGRGDENSRCAEIVQSINNCGKDARSQHSFGQLLANDVGEEKGVKNANQGIDGGERGANKELQRAN